MVIQTHTRRTPEVRRLVRNGSSSSVTSIRTVSDRLAMKVRGVFYPLHGVRHLLRDFPATFDPETEVMPGISTRGWFSNPNNVPLHSTIINLGTHRYLVVGYYDQSLNLSTSFNNVAPNILWQGEIALFPLGQYVYFLSKMGPKALIKTAVLMFMTKSLEIQRFGGRMPSQLLVGQ